MEIEEKRGSRRLLSWSRIKPALLIVGSVALVWVVIGELGQERFIERVEFGLEKRFDVLRQIMAQVSMDIFYRSPLFGVGLGCWHLMAYELSSFEMAGFSLDFAHNDHLQLLAEVGLVGAMPWVLALGVIIGASFRIWNNCERNAVKILLLGSTLSMLLPLLHALVDFPFHIAGVAIIWAAAVGIQLRLLAAAGDYQ